MTLGVADGIGDLRTVLAPALSARMCGCRSSGRSAACSDARVRAWQLKERLFGGAGLAEELISALEERALWSRYGL